MTWRHRVLDLTTGTCTDSAKSTPSTQLTSNFPIAWVTRLALASLPAYGSLLRGDPWVIALSGISTRFTHGLQGRSSGSRADEERQPSCDISIFTSCFTSFASLIWPQLCIVLLRHALTCSQRGRQTAEQQPEHQASLSDSRGACSSSAPPTGAQTHALPSWQLPLQQALSAAATVHALALCAALGCGVLHALYPSGGCGLVQRAAQWASLMLLLVVLLVALAVTPHQVASPRLPAWSHLLVHTGLAGLALWLGVASATVMARALAAPTTEQQGRPPPLPVELRLPGIGPLSTGPWVALLGGGLAVLLHAGMLRATVWLQSALPAVAAALAPRRARQSAHLRRTFAESLRLQGFHSLLRSAWPPKHSRFGGTAAAATPRAASAVSAQAAPARAQPTDLLYRPDPEKHTPFGSAVRRLRPSKAGWGSAYPVPPSTVAAAHGGSQETPTCSQQDDTPIEGAAATRDSGNGGGGSGGTAARPPSELRTRHSQCPHAGSWLDPRDVSLDAVGVRGALQHGDLFGSLPDLPAYSPYSGVPGTSAPTQAPSRDTMAQAYGYGDGGANDGIRSGGGVVPLAESLPGRGRLPGQQRPHVPVESAVGATRPVQGGVRPGLSAAGSAGAAGAAAGTGASTAGRPSALYRSPLQHFTVVYKVYLSTRLSAYPSRFYPYAKLEAPPSVSFEHVSSTLTAAAHRTVEAVMNRARVVAGPGGAGGSAAATAAPCWVACTSQVHCLMDYNQMVLMLQRLQCHRDGHDLKVQDLADALQGVECGLRQQTAASSRGGSGSASVFTAVSLPLPRPPSADSRIEHVVPLESPTSTHQPATATAAGVAYPGQLLVSVEPPVISVRAGRGLGMPGTSAGTSRKPPELALAAAAEDTDLSAVQHPCEGGQSGSTTVYMDVSLGAVDSPEEAGGPPHAATPLGSAAVVEGCSQAQGPHAAPVADVRVVVKQHGAVVAEAERVAVGPQGTSVRLDLRGLQEGSATLLVLPVRQSASGQEPAGRVAEARQEEVHEQTEPCTPLFLTSLAVVPSAVAEELCGLMRDISDRLLYNSPAGTDPRVARARAFTHHFSPLVCDMVSLTLGCNRLVAAVGDFNAQVDAAAAAAAAGAAAGPNDEICAAGDQTCEVLTEELHALGRQVLPYLMDRGLSRTVGYLLEHVHAAGVTLHFDKPVHGDSTEAAGAAAPGLPPGAAQRARRGDWTPSSVRGDYRPAEAGVPGAGGGADGHQQAVPGHQAGAVRLPLLSALQAVRAGFSDARTEEACATFRCREAAGSDRFTVLTALLVLIAAGLVLALTETQVDGDRGNGGGPLVLLSRSLAWRFPLPRWAATEVALACSFLMLPGVLLVAARSVSSPRMRDECVRMSHAACSVALYGYNKWAHAAGRRLLTARVLAALVVLAVPASYSVQVKGSKLCWLVDAAFLTLLFGGLDGVGTHQERDGGSSGSEPWASFLIPAAAVGALVLTSIALAVARDLCWRLHFLRQQRCI